MADPDLEKLLKVLTTFAMQQLEKRGAFIPFGAQMDSTGGLTMVAAQGSPGARESELISLLIAGARAHAAAGEIRAVGICSEATGKPPGQAKTRDAIRVQLEHQNGEVVEIILFHWKNLWGRRKYGELLEAPAIKRVFGDAA